MKSKSSPTGSVVDRLFRILTVAPFMAALALGVLYALKPGLFAESLHFILCLVFLTAMPLLAYPLQLLLPSFRSKGREGQRNLAMMMAVAGYLCGILSCLLLKAPSAVWIIYLTYLLSGLGILLFNKLLRIRASGHSCGVVGPVALLWSFLGLQALWGLLLLIPACLSSLRMKRHTVPQLLWGGVISLAALFLSAGWVQAMT